MRMIQSPVSVDCAFRYVFFYFSYTVCVPADVLETLHQAAFRYT